MTTRLCTALNQALPQDGSVPEWIELIPAGPEITGVDGRTWQFGPEELQAVLSHFAVHLGEALIDWEHASELRAPNGEEAPAAGWIKEIEARDGALWGRVEWTDRAAEQIRSREYRYLSPVFDYTANGRRVRRLASAGLTNRPNFALRALNQEIHAAAGGDSDPHQGDIPPMNKELLKRLGLPEDATDEQALAAVDGLQGDLETARNQASQAQSLERYVPRTEFDAVHQRARNAEERLATLQQERQEAEIEALLDKHATRFPPAEREHYRALCQKEGGQELFTALMDGKPELAGDSGLDGKTPPEGQKRALNAEMREVMRQFGNSEDDLKQYGGLGNGADR